MGPSLDSWPRSSSMAPAHHLQMASPSPDLHQDRLKKPRHRHSPTQLAALNELYDRNEHPPLDLRTSLAERLGMETKTVNAWFQNKRASSKKRTRGVPYDLPPIYSLMGSTSSFTTNHLRHSELDDFADDDYSIDSHTIRSASFVSPDNTRPQSSFYAGNPHHTHFLAETAMPRRMRMRPTPEQTDELRNLYNVNPHPTTDQRQALSERIGMRYQSITNWFQNQRSLAKKRREDAADAAAAAAAKFAASRKSMPEYPNESRTYSAFPPPSFELRHSERHSRSVSPSGGDEPSPRRSNHRRSATPYGSVIASLSRPRRTRPEPYQLDALKDLFMKTTNPTIEERSALAVEIGMDIGKVTNWFRNLRQTARKRAKRPGSGDEDDDDNDSYNGRNIDSTSVSRSGSPSLRSSPSSMMDLDGDDYEYSTHGHNGHYSDAGSDDEYQEAVTPSPEPSLSPPPGAAPLRVGGLSGSGMAMAIDRASYAEYEKATASKFSGIKIDDALLLLSFHQHIVH